MSEITVHCCDCQLDNGRHKVWRWLCEDCATECAQSHKQQTGHTNVNIQGERIATFDELASLLRTKRITGGR